MREKAEKFPKELGACADLLYKMDLERTAFSRKADAVQERQVELRRHILEVAKKQKATAGAGKTGKIRIDTKELLQVEDWPKVWAFIMKLKRPDLLQKKLHAEAINELLEAGEDIPGIKIERIKVVSKPTKV